jgi:hypothetical protein
MSFEYENLPDPFSVAVPIDLTPRDPWKIYEFDENEHEDPIFGMNASENFNSETCTYTQSIRLQDLNRKRISIESVCQTNTVLVEIHDELKIFCLKNYQYMLQSFQEEIDSMYRLTFNEGAWYSFLVTLKHRSALVKRRWKRSPEQVSARKADFERLQAKWKRQSAWSDISSRFLRVTRQSVCQRQLKSFQVKWKRYISWSDAVSKLLSVTRQSSWQRLRRSFQLTWMRLIAWRGVTSIFLTLSNRNSRQKHRNRFQLKWKRCISWSDAVSRLLPVTRQSSWQGRLKLFQIKWKRAMAWSGVAGNLQSATRDKSLQKCLEVFQRKCKLRELWSNFKVGISKVEPKVSSFLTAQWKIDIAEFQEYRSDIIAKWTRGISKATYISGSARVKGWKYVAFWSVIISRVMKECHITTRAQIVWSASLSKELERRAVKLRDIWSLMITGIIKQRRNTRRVLIELNYQDFVATAIENWEQLLKDRNSIRTVFLTRAYFLQQWSRICCLYNGVSKFNAVSDREMSVDMKLMLYKHKTVLQDEIERTPAENIHLFEKTYGKWPLSWQLFKRANMHIYDRIGFGERTRIKKLFMEVFCLVEVYLESRAEDTAMVCPNPNDDYRMNVNRMFEVKFLGNFVVDWDDLTLRLYCPKYKKRGALFLTLNLHQIEDIVGFFYASGGDVFASFLANFPNEMSRYPAMNPVNAFESNSYLDVFKFYLMAKYKNRFHVSHKIDVYNRVCVIVKCRMVRKADGSVSREGKKHECGLFEALEQFKRGI